MKYIINWTDKNTEVDCVETYTDIDEAEKEARTLSNKHGIACILAFFEDDLTGTLQYSFGRRGEVDGDL